MGLSIHLVTDNYEDVYSTEFYRNEKEYRSRMGLSKDFAELIVRVNTSFGEAELKQIEKITEVDLLPLWNMATYHNVEDDVPNGNIKSVIETVDRLIEKLNSLCNLERKITPYDNDIDFEFYFSDFAKDKNNGTNGNNFGQDLRNLKKYLKYALSKGSTKVWFNIE